MKKFRIITLTSLIALFLTFIGCLTLEYQKMVVFSLIFSFLSLSISALCFYIIVVNAYKDENK